MDQSKDTFIEKIITYRKEKSAKRIKLGGACSWCFVLTVVVQIRFLCLKDEKQIKLGRGIWFKLVLMI